MHGRVHPLEQSPTAHYIAFEKSGVAHAKVNDSLEKAHQAYEQSGQKEGKGAKHAQHQIEDSPSPASHGKLVQTYKTAKDRQERAGNSRHIGSIQHSAGKFETGKLEGLFATRTVDHQTWIAVVDPNFSLAVWANVGSGHFG